MTTYGIAPYVKLDGKYKVYCNGEHVDRWDRFADGTSEPDGEGWVDYINLDDEGFWESDEKGPIIRRRYGDITWEPAE